MARKRRGLSAEDRALWKRVAASVTPKRPEPPPAERDPPPAPAPALRPDPPPLLPAPTLPPFKLGERAPAAGGGHDLSPPIGERLARAPVHMDRKAFGKMKKGKLAPEARLDLHGLTLDQAHPALTRFISESYMRQMRLVLVITGKGKDRDEPGPMPVPRGVLKHQVPHWLTSGPLRLMVLQITEAHLRHGGTGAYYVYLRRHR